MGKLNGGEVGGCDPEDQEDRETVVNMFWKEERDFLPCADRCLFSVFSAVKCDVLCIVPNTNEGVPVFRSFVFPFFATAGEDSTVKLMDKVRKVRGGRERGSFEFEVVKISSHRRSASFSSCFLFRPTRRLPSSMVMVVPTMLYAMRA